MTRRTWLATIGGFAVVVAALVVFGVAQRAALPEPQIARGQGALRLYVSNQSRDLPTVDIVVRVDGRVAVADLFHVGEQHDWTELVLDVPAGAHDLLVVSDRGDARFAGRIEAYIPTRRRSCPSPTSRRRAGAASQCRPSPDDGCTTRGGFAGGFAEGESVGGGSVGGGSAEGRVGRKSPLMR